MFIIQATDTYNKTVCINFRAVLQFLILLAENFQRFKAYGTFKHMFFEKIVFLKTIGKDKIIKKIMILIRHDQLFNVFLSIAVTSLFI